MKQKKLAKIGTSKFMMQCSSFFSKLKFVQPHKFLMVLSQFFKFLLVQLHKFLMVIEPVF